MEKKYIKPEMEISQVEMDALCELSISGTEYGSDGNDWGIRSKTRGVYEEEEEWVKETDMWGNECWTRTR
ncbi:MAG: hypothetical protein IJZ68_00505 [Bacteroidaceae bacterium]|nr:hypothetical protein [Bacteroidaceae bacterium]